MADLRQEQLDVLIGRSLLAAQTIAGEVRRQLVDAVLSGRFSLDDLRVILDEWIPIAVQSMTDAELAARAAGFQEIVALMPELLTERSLSPLAAPFVRSESILRFPAIEAATQELLSRNIVTRSVFDQLEEDARRKAFTVAYLDAEDAIETVRDALLENLKEPSLRGFRVELEERLGASRLGDAHMETVYRTNIQRAFHEGMDQLASDPVVEEIFPYQEYLAIRDDRAREEHLALETLGLSGTGVYRRDDPMWNLFLPPWGYNCRCTVNLLTVEDASRRGVKEASEWLETGIRPTPEWRLDSIPFRPEDGFVGAGRSR